MSDRQYIWNFFKSKLNNEYGVSGLMGNLIGIKPIIYMDEKGTMIIQKNIPLKLIVGKYQKKILYIMHLMVAGMVLHNGLITPEKKTYIICIKVVIIPQ